ncbi:hypothetical protein BY996DRAFT_6496674, partial [Phakopsora pachyrhizi]
PSEGRAGRAARAGKGRAGLGPEQARAGKGLAGLGPGRQGPIGQVGQAVQLEGLGLLPQRELDRTIGYSHINQSAQVGKVGQARAWLGLAGLGPGPARAGWAWLGWAELGLGQAGAWFGSAVLGKVGQ